MTLYLQVNGVKHPTCESCRRYVPDSPLSSNYGWCQLDDMTVEGAWYYCAHHTEVGQLERAT